MERWVCKRCFASNDGAVDACTTCGWPRGEAVEPGAGDVPAYALPAPAAPRAVPWWRTLVRFWWVAALVVVAGVTWFSQAHRDASGSITSGGKVDIGSLKVGDCFDTPASGEVSEVTGRPCGEAHEYELFAIAQDTVHSDFPDDAAMQSFLLDACGQAFADYVGTSIDSSRLGILQVTPTPDGWARGDRAFFCATYDPENNRLTSSVRGSGR